MISDVLLFQPFLRMTHKGFFIFYFGASRRASAWNWRAQPSRPGQRLPSGVALWLPLPTVKELKLDNFQLLPLGDSIQNNLRGFRKRLHLR